MSHLFSSIMYSFLLCLHFLITVKLAVADVDLCTSEFPLSTTYDKASCMKFTQLHRKVTVIRSFQRYESSCFSIVLIYAAF